MRKSRTLDPFKLYWINYYKRKSYLLTQEQDMFSAQLEDSQWDLLRRILGQKIIPAHQAYKLDKKNRLSMRLARTYAPVFVHNM